MLTYDAACDALVLHLRQDAAEHDAERYDSIGRRFDNLEYHFPRGTSAELARLHIALTFWDGWIDARNHGWPDGPIGVGDWPALARDVAADLEAGRDVSNPLVLSRFDIVAHARLNERVQTLATRLRSR